MPWTAPVYRFILVFAFALLLPQSLFAQTGTLSLAVEGLSYGGDDYDQTNGDRAVTLAGSYRFRPAWQVGAGAFVGKFDHPSSDPSFTAIALFVEPARVWQVAPRIRAITGARVAWEHERVGDQSNGLWAYGWSWGPSGQLDVSLSDRVFVGGTLTWIVLDLGRDGPVSRNGHRLQSGGRVGLQW